MSRVGVDVGGTFTDFVLADPERERLVHHKEPSTPADPAVAVIRGLGALLRESSTRPEEITGITHGTTIGLNAIIQRRGARIALVVSEGYRDLLEIGRSRMPSSFDLHARRETPLVPRDLVIEIGARLGADAVPSVVPDDEELSRVTEALRASGADAAALTILHAHTNPVFEARIAQRLSASGVPVTASATVWPEVREYERTLVAVLNAYIGPLMRDYLARLEESVRGLGVTAPIHIAASNGGSLGIASAAERPIETVLSGPSSGVMAAVRVAAGRSPRRITFDMGGTSSDIAVAQARAPEFATHTTIGGLPLILPVVAVNAIGAGGGSIIRVDEQGVCKVGPESSGADPGPVAYGRGGTRPTITDCYLVSGIIDPRLFLGGRITLDARAAAEALGGLGLGTPEEAADGALRVATAGMAASLQKILAQRGLDPATFTLVPYGGAGPTHAALLAEEAGIGEIIVPPTAATFCALGAAGADLRRDFARSLRRPLDAAGVAELKAVLAELTDAALRWLAAEGDASGPPVLTVEADMSYLGQAYELRVPLPDGADVAECFHAEHERLYGFRDDQAPIRLGTARLAASAPRAAVAVPEVASGTGHPSPIDTRPITLAGHRLEAAVYRRGDLGAGDRFAGPAIVEQDDTTVLVPPSWRANVDDTGNLVLVREDRA